ncbi:MAG: DUF1772 domain-containing protein [Dongiaceae bacterium]
MAGQLALAVAALFAGAAFYISVVEQPARMGLDDRSLLTEWKAAYRRGATLQAPLAIVGFLLGLLAWWQTDQPLWLVGAAALIANWPYTLIVIMPVNRQLRAMDPVGPGSDVRTLIARWAALHAGRTALGFAATLIFLWASIG